MPIVDLLNHDANCDGYKIQDNRLKITPCLMCNEENQVAVKYGDLDITSSILVWGFLDKKNTNLWSVPIKMKLPNEKSLVIKGHSGPLNSGIYQTQPYEHSIDLERDLIWISGIPLDLKMERGAQVLKGVFMRIYPSTPNDILNALQKHAVKLLIEGNRSFYKKLDNLLDELPAKQKSRLAIKNSREWIAIMLNRLNKIEKR